MQEEAGEWEALVGLWKGSIYGRNMDPDAFNFWEQRIAQSTYLTSSIQTNHKDTHLLGAEHAFKSKN